MGTCPARLDTCPARRDPGHDPALLAARPRAAWTIALAVALPCAVLAGCGPGPIEPTTLRDGTPGFEEGAEAAGIDFHMTFLRREQGEAFKINLYDHGAGVCVADYDGDGLDDVYLLNQLKGNGLFRNRGDGTFVDVTEQAGVALEDRVCTSGSFADYDNDGDQDLFVASTRGGNTLFRNEGDGRLVDVTEEAGVALVAHSQGVTFFDYDRDGYLDLYVTNTARWTLDHRDADGLYYVGALTLFDLVESRTEPNVLYRNRGDGTFADVTAEAGVGGEGWGGDVATFDMDGDGDLDLFVTNMFGASVLYRNDGRRFTDVTESALGRTSWGAVGCKPLDQDGDGLLDLFLVDMHSDMWMPADMDPWTIECERKFTGPEGPMVELGLMSAAKEERFRANVELDDESISRVVFGNTLFRNRGGGKFEEVSDQARAETLWPWGIAAADFDLDGHEDAFLPSGMGYPYFGWQNELLMNAGDGTFRRRSPYEGIEPRPGGPRLQKQIAGRPASRSSRSAAVLDYDHDGRPDLIVNNFNERPYLYRNRFPERQWVAFRLRGSHSNRDAIGALVRVTAGGRTQVRQVQGASGYLAQSTRTLYFGLGDNERIDRCEVIWPCGGREEVQGLQPGRVHDLVEPGADHH